jgi:hypothetical protein
VRKRRKSWDTKNPWEEQKPNTLLPVEPQGFDQWWMTEEEARRAVEQLRSNDVPAAGGLEAAIKANVWAPPPVLDERAWVRAIDRWYAQVDRGDDPVEFWIDDNGAIRWDDGPANYIHIARAPVEEFLGGEVGCVQFLLVDGTLALLTWTPGRMSATCTVEFVA